MHEKSWKVAQKCELGNIKKINNTINWFKNRQQANN